MDINEVKLLLIISVEQENMYIYVERYRYANLIILYAVRYIVNEGCMGIIWYFLVSMLKDVWVTRFNTGKCRAKRIKLCLIRHFGVC